MSTAQMNLLISTNRIGTEASANPVRGSKVNYSACKWYQSSVAMNHFIGGKSQEVELQLQTHLNVWDRIFRQVHVRWHW